MAQSLKSKISQMANAYSINAIIETAKQVQKENSTRTNVLDPQVSFKLKSVIAEIRRLSGKIETEAEKDDPDLTRIITLQTQVITYTHRSLEAIMDRVVLTSELENK